MAFIKGVGSTESQRSIILGSSTAVVVRGMEEFPYQAHHRRDKHITDLITGIMEAMIETPRPLELEVLRMTLSKQYTAMYNRLRD